MGLGTYEQSLSGAIAVGLSILIRDFFFAKSANLKRYVVAPVIDMFNHNSNSNAEASFNYFSGSFELRTDSYGKGDQVYINYGKQSNDRLFQYYGFIEENNPYDSYDFGATPLELILKYSDKIAETIEIPNSPTPGSVDFNTLIILLL